MKHVLRIPDRFKSTQTPKLCAIAHKNGQKWPESRVFYDFVKLVLRGPRLFKSTPYPKPCDIAHENGQKCSKSRVFYDFVEFVLRVRNV